MKIYGSIAAGVCTIWLCFEPDLDQSPDPGSGHVFTIIARRIALKVMDGSQGCGIRIRILPRLLATADFYEIWCRDRAYDTELSKLQKLKVKGQGQAQQKHILTELLDNELCRG